MKAELKMIRTTKQQGGYALVAIVSFIMIVAAMATGGVSLTAKSERLAGNAIQRSRAFLAADGASEIAEKDLEDMMVRRVFADSTGSSGIYTVDQRVEQWWRDGNRNNVTPQALHEVDEDAILGVVEPPKYVIEQLGDFVSDGGTSIINLDIGGASYGRNTAGGREFLLFSVEALGKGSFDEVETVVESTVAFSY